ncbi:MAG: Dyp-type peroxidase [Actinomycetota bacterium]|nr:MAG: Dyp-type peroxidase [Actinomycetota bacterium]
MTYPQVGLFAVGSPSHSYLEFKTEPQSSNLDLIKAVANMEFLQSTVNGLNLVIGVRPSIWSSLAPSDLPPGIFDFGESLIGPDGFAMPATQRDLWLWISGQSTSQVFDAGLGIINILSAYATIVEDISGWSYRQNRDLTGFIDGSANPSLLEAPEIALFPHRTPGAGGSILLFQKWRHNLKSFGGLSMKEQEMVIGRTKEMSYEFEEKDLPSNSHVARTTLTADGRELPIFRRNVSYGTPTDHGTVFVGFSNDQSRLHEMLKKMTGIPDGTRDALTHFTTPLTGSYYFIPSIDSLRKFADRTEFLSARSEL